MNAPLLMSLPSPLLVASTTVDKPPSSQHLAAAIAMDGLAAAVMAHPSVSSLDLVEECQT
jgi:hypothetical protein